MSGYWNARFQNISLLQQSVIETSVYRIAKLSKLPWNWSNLSAHLITGHQVIEVPISASCLANILSSKLKELCTRLWQSLFGVSVITTIGKVSPYITCFANKTKEIYPLKSTMKTAKHASIHVLLLLYLQGKSFLL